MPDLYGQWVSVYSTKSRNILQLCASRTVDSRRPALDQVQLTLFAIGTRFYRSHSGSKVICGRKGIPSLKTKYYIPLIDFARKAATPSQGNAEKNAKKKVK